MKRIEVSNLQNGALCESDLFTESGELLVSKGMTITEKHLDIMRRRNIYEVYAKMADEAEELHKILTMDFGQLEELHFDDPAHSVLNAPKKFPVPKAMENPALKEIKAGQDGLNQLANSEKAKALDNSIKDGAFSDKPVGPALKLRSVQISVGQRTVAYKTEMKTNYTEALQQVRGILVSIADNKSMDGTVVRNMVDRFVKTWVTDRNMTLNLTHSKPTDDDYLFHHSLNVCLLSLNIAAAFGYSEKQVIDIGIAATLHDVGMMLVPQEIFKKKGRLTKDEFYEVQKHSILGLHLLENITRLPDSAQFVAYQTHERENGSGYPKQRSGRLIHSFSKIVQIADVYESLSSPREYRDAFLPYKAMETIIKMSRKTLLSNEFVKAFITYMSLFPIGSLVELSDKTIGKVIHSNEAHFTKPIVSIIAGPQSQLLASDKIFQIDLLKRQDLQIVRAVEAKELPNQDIMAGF